MYHKDTVYNSERPTYTLSVITQTGKHGTFTCKRSTGEMTPITWTFEGGGGGNSLFIITATYNSDTKTWSTDRTWDEVKEAVAKSKNPNDYAISLDGSLLSPNALVVGRNNSEEIINVKMQWIAIDSIVIDVNTVPDGFGSGLVLFNNYVRIEYDAASSNIKFTYANSGEIPQAIIRSALISKSDDGTLVCDPPNAVELFAELFDTNNAASAQFICPLYYNGETYHFETSEMDSSNIVSLYFSTTTNTAAFTPTADYHPATKKYVDDHTPSKISKFENDSNYITAAHVYDGILISSSTPNSTKKFKITVDDTGALTTTGVTEA